MKKISRIAEEVKKQLAQTSQQTISTNYSDEQLNTIGRLFVRIGVSWGHLWSSQFKSAKMLEVAKREWLIDLAKYSPLELHNALARCKREHPDSPPTVQQFVLCAEVEIKDREHQEPIKEITYQETDKDKGARRERGFSAIKTIQEILKQPTINLKKKSICQET